MALYMAHNSDGLLETLREARTLSSFSDFLEALFSCFDVNFRLKT